MLTAEFMAVGIRHTGHVATLHPQKLAQISQISGGRSVSIASSRTQATEIFSLAVKIIF
jgi:hypothetical protein